MERVGGWDTFLAGTRIIGAVGNPVGLVADDDEIRDRPDELFYVPMSAARAFDADTVALAVNAAEVPLPGAGETAVPAVPPGSSMT